MLDFLRKWGRLMAQPIINSYSGLSAAASLAAKLISFSVVAGAATAFWWWFASLSVPAWVAGVTCLSGLYLAVTGGMAWERSKSSGIAMGPLVFDDKWPEKIFCVRVENRSAAPLVNVRAAVTRLVDENGKTLLSPTWRVHWRDKPAGTDTIEVLGGHAAEAGVFQVDRKPDGTTRLSVRTPGDIGPFIGFDKPVVERPRRVIVDVVVTSETKSGEHLPPAKATYALAICPEMWAGYRVEEPGTL